MCLQAVMHTGEDCEETESDDYVGRFSVALIRRVSNIAQARGVFRWSTAHARKMEVKILLVK